MQELHLTRILKSLGQGSVCAVQDGQQLTETHRYLHVERPIQQRLKSLMESVDEEGGGIILLIGSAGDGKSHLISCMKESSNWPDRCFYNDATASCSPLKTAVETLKEALTDFSDEYIDTTRRKLILAINLGKLNAFAEDEEASNRYARLIAAVRPILDNKASKNEEGRIKLLDCSEEQIFELYPSRSSDCRLESHFLSALIEKIASPTRNNPFYAAYQKDLESGDESIAKHPVIINYRLLQLPCIRVTLIKSIIEAIIRCRLRITPREFLDFVREILICPDLDNYLEKEDLVKALLPSLLYSGGNNTIIKAFSKLDPLKESSIEHDRLLSVLYTSEEIPEDHLSASLKNSIPKELLDLFRSLFYKERTGESRTALVRCVFRLEHLLNYHSNSSTYCDYIDLLCNLASGEKKRISAAFQELEELVQHSLAGNAGSYYSGDNIVPLNIRGDKYQLFAEIDFGLKDTGFRYDAEHPGIISTEFSLFWKVEQHEKEPVPALKMDYRLFEYLKELRKGHLAVAYENKKDLFFDRFVRNLARFSQRERKVTIIRYDGTKTELSQKQYKLRLK